MTERNFNVALGAWTDATSWGPAGTPSAGDVLHLAGGEAILAGSDLAGGVLDSETLDLGSTDADRPAVLQATDVVFGSGFVQQMTAGALAAELDLVGNVTLGGDFEENATNGFLHVHLSPDTAGSSLTTLTGQFEVSNGAHVTIDGGRLKDLGTIAVDGGTLLIGADTLLSGPATIVISQGGTLVLNGPVAKNLTIAFADGTGQLVLGDSQTFAASVTGFQAGDSITFAQTLATTIKQTGLDQGVVRVLTGADSDTDGAVLATFALSGVDTLHSTNLALVRDGIGNTSLVYADQFDWAGGTADWYAPGQWHSSGVGGIPDIGDTAIISSGTATLDGPGPNMLDNQTVILSGSGGLDIRDGQLGAGLTIKSWTAASGSGPDLVLRGQTGFNGALLAHAQHSTLAIDVEPDTDSSAGRLTLNSDSTVIVESGASLELTAGETTANTRIGVDGTLIVDAGAILDGSGTVALLNGQLIARGTVGDQLHIDMSAKSDVSNTVRIDDIAKFHATIDGFGTDDAIDVGVTAARSTFNTQTGQLTLENADGSVIGSLHFSGAYAARDFHLASDGQGGTRITDVDTASGINVVDVSGLARPVVLAAQQSETLQQILIDQFGAEALQGVTQVVVRSAAMQDQTWASYWDLAHPTVASWSINGQAIPADTYRTIAASDWASTTLTAGSAIDATASVLLPSSAQGSTVTGYTSYAISTVDPRFVQTSTPPTAATIVAAANAISSIYQGVPNLEDCYHIAAQVAAAAGAPFGGAMSSSNPDNDNASGFWRIAYAAPQDGTATDGWGSLLEAGDIVRVGWQSGGEHSFTIIQPERNGMITVLDNGYQPSYLSADDENEIGIHTANYWQYANPANVIVFRVDPNGMFLIEGNSVDGEILRGDAHDDLFIPGEDTTTIRMGTGSNLVADVGAHLDGTTITGFGDGDAIDVTDLAAAGAHVSYDPISGTLRIGGAGQTLTLHLAAGLTGAFSVGADGGRAALDGGTLGTIYDVLYSDNDSQGTRVSFAASVPTAPRIDLATAPARTIDPAALRVSGSGDPGTTITLTTGGTKLASTTVGSDARWSLALPTALASGQTSLAVTETNGAGATSAAATLLVVNSGSEITLGLTGADANALTARYSAAGILEGYTRKTVSADGGWTIDQYDANAVAVQHTGFSADGRQIWSQAASIRTLYGHDLAGTTTLVASGDVSTTGSIGAVTDGLTGASLTTLAQSHASVTTLSGDNTIIANGSDTVILGGGLDTVDITTGNSSVSSADGAMQFSGTGSATLQRSAGSATVHVTGGDGQFVARSGNNVFDGASDLSGHWTVATGTGDDVITAAGGGSVISPGAGRNVVTLGAGHDEVYLSGSGDLVAGGSGSATIVNIGTQADLFGGQGMTTLYDGGSSTTYVGQDGASADIMAGADGTYWLSGRSTVTAGAGRDTISAVNADVTVNGGTGELALLETGAGKITFISGNGTSQINAGVSGTAAIFGTPGSVIAYAGAAAGTQITAGAGSETISAASATGAVTFYTGSGSASLVGGAGNDAFVIGSGSATVSGGAGSNTFIFEQARTGGTASTITITDFGTSAGNRVALLGYGGQALQTALAGQTHANGSTTLTLADSTKVVFANVDTLNATSFLG